MEIFEVVLGLISLADKLIERGTQTGELSDAQRAVLGERQAAMAAHFNEAPPPPPGATR